MKIKNFGGSGNVGSEVPMFGYCVGRTKSRMSGRIAASSNSPTISPDSATRIYVSIQRQPKEGRGPAFSSSFICAFQTGVLQNSSNSAIAREGLRLPSTRLLEKSK